MAYELVERCTRAMERFRVDQRRYEVFDGHDVARVVWQTERIVVFEDEAGRIWRYVFSWRRAWPVLVRAKGVAIAGCLRGELGAPIRTRGPDDREVREESGR